MLEFAIGAAAWVAFLVFASRKGTERFESRTTAIALPLGAAIVAAVIEALPTSQVTFGFTLRTVIAVLAGVFGGRLFVKVARLWAMGHARRAAEAAAAGVPPPTAPPRFMHPLIAVGLVIAGVPALWHLVAANHALLESEGTPRDETTGIVHGAEEIRLEGRAGGPAALLVHGLFTSPAEFGELPKALHAKGFTVHAPLLPGHGRTPDALQDVWAADYRKAVAKARAALAAGRSGIALVGSGMGATLALLDAADTAPSALVAANPYAGSFATPAGSPFALDDVVGPLSRAVRFVLSDGRGHALVYRTQSLHALRQCRDLGQALAAKPGAPTAPTLVLLGEQDAFADPARTAAWVRERLPAARRTQLGESGSAVFTGPEAERAVREVVAFLAR